LDLDQRKSKSKVTISSMQTDLSQLVRLNFSLSMYLDRNLDLYFRSVKSLYFLT